MFEYKSPGWSWIIFSDWTKGFDDFAEQVKIQNLAVTLEGKGRRVFYCMGDQAAARRSHEALRERKSGQPVSRLPLEVPTMERISIDSYWKSRPKTPDQLALRLRTLLRLLRPIAPPFLNWFQVVDERTFRLIDDEDGWLTDEIAAHICRDELQQPSPYFGYRSRTMNTTPDKLVPGSLCIHMSAGGQWINSLVFHPLAQVAPDPAYITYAIFQRTVLAISRTFEPDYCTAGPYSLWKDMDMGVYKEGPVITPCWMIHLSPPLAQRITPPSEFVREHFADGSLFLAATDEDFDPENPGHVEAANRRFTVLDTLQEKLPPEQWRR